MNSDVSHWDRVSRRLSRLVVLAIVVAAVLGVSLKYLPLIQRNELAQLRVYREEARLMELSNEVSRLRAELSSYRDDREALKRQVEIVCREKLRWAKPGEAVFRFAEE